VICYWCRQSTVDTKDVILPLLNDRPMVLVEQHDSTQLLVLHRACWERIKQLKEHVQ